MVGFVLSLLLHAFWILSWLRLIPYDVGIGPLDLQPKQEIILHGLLMMGAAALGWFYVFKRRFKALWIFMAAYAGLWILVAAVPSSVGWGSVPSDAAMQDSFSRHEADFNKLVKMSEEDSHLEVISLEFVRAAPTGPYTRPAATLDKDRWDEYRGLFKKLGVFGLRKPQGWKVELILPVAEQLQLTRRVGKGYAYSTEEPLPVLGSSTASRPRASGPCSRRSRIIGTCITSGQTTRPNRTF
jgi:hypothetical protein